MGASREMYETIEYPRELLSKFRKSRERLAGINEEHLLWEYGRYYKNCPVKPPLTTSDEVG